MVNLKSPHLPTIQLLIPRVFLLFFVIISSPNCKAGSTRQFEVRVKYQTKKLCGTLCLTGKRESHCYLTGSQTYNTDDKGHITSSQITVKNVIPQEHDIESLNIDSLNKRTLTLLKDACTGRQLIQTFTYNSDPCNPTAVSLELGENDPNAVMLSCPPNSITKTYHFLDFFCQNKVDRGLICDPIVCSPFIEVRKKARYSTVSITLPTPSQKKIKTNRYKVVPCSREFKDKFYWHYYVEGTEVKVFEFVQRKHKFRVINWLMPNET